MFKCRQIPDTFFATLILLSCATFQHDTVLAYDIVMDRRLLKKKVFIAWEKQLRLGLSPLVRFVLWLLYCSSDFNNLYSEDIIWSIHFVASSFQNQNTALLFILPIQWDMGLIGKSDKLSPWCDFYLPWRHYFK